MAWEDLLSIKYEAEELARLDREQPPISCPNDGTPLQPGPNGELHCKFDGYQWPRGGKL